MGFLSASPLARVVLFASVSAGAGAGVIACATYSTVAPSKTESDATSVTPTIGGDDAAVANACAPGTKMCAGACVSIDDPRYGCATDSCTPCSLPNTKLHKCSAAGKCEVAQCAAGWDYCDLAEGCPIDPVSPDTCGGCAARGGKACAASDVCLWSASGSTCELATGPVATAQCGAGKPLTNCDRSCVDLQTHPRHCGQCTTACAATAGGSAACTAGKCAINCDETHDHCAGNLATCESLSPLFADKDGDGWGGSPVIDSQSGKQAFGCKAATGQAIKGGDCVDDPQNGASKDVFPGQTKFFTTAYVVSGQPSFDYNCNGKVDFNQPTGGSCSPCVQGYIGKVACGISASLANCGIAAETPSEQAAAASPAAVEIQKVPASGSGQIACPLSAVVSCR